MAEVTPHVGLDVHKQSISVAMLLPGSSKATQWQLRNDPGEVRRLARRLRREGREVVCAYEAGPCGYAVQRQLLGEGVAGQVVAASLIPRKPGDRIKTDRRDASKLAELLRAHAVRTWITALLPRSRTRRHTIRNCSFAPAGDWWDNPTMSTATADSKRRVVLPAAKPGDVFDIQTQGEGRLLLVRLERPEPGPRMSQSRSLEAIAAAPLQPKMTWESLKATTREP